MDGSEGARKAFDAAMELASRVKLKLHMISVEEPPPPGYAETVWEREEDKADEDSYFERLGAQARSLASLYNIELERNAAAGHGVKAIVEFARQERFDLLVIGYSGHSRILRTPLGRHVAKSGEAGALQCAGCEMTRPAGKGGSGCEY